MTNIMAYVKNPNPDTGLDKKVHEDPQTTLFDNTPDESELDKPQPVGLAMADSLASGNGEVIRGHQKLFQVGNNFVMGTGAMDLIYEVAKELKSDKSSSPLAVSKEIFTFIEQYASFQPGEQLNFIVAGYQDNTLQIYHARTNRIKKPVLVEQGFAVDGSGASFVSKAIERDTEMGMNVPNEHTTIADIVTSFSDLGYAATQSAGVDDYLQFGFLVDGKAIALMHPSVKIKHVPDSYAGEDGKFDSDKHEQNSNVYYEIRKRVSEVLHLQRKYNQISSGVRDGVYPISGEVFQDLANKAHELRSKNAELNKVIDVYCNEMHGKPPE